MSNKVRFLIIILILILGGILFEVTPIDFNLENPVRFEKGSPPGGHHRSGSLIFPKLNSQTKKISLIIQDNLFRVFEWDLK